MALGATAAQALLGNAFRVTQRRGQVVESTWGSVVATVHPSSVLRAPADARAKARREFFRDLARVATRLTPTSARAPATN